MTCAFSVITLISHLLLSYDAFAPLNPNCVPFFCQGADCVMWLCTQVSNMQREIIKRGRAWCLCPITQDGDWSFRLSDINDPQLQQANDTTCDKGCFSPLEQTC